MAKIKDVTDYLEEYAPLSLQESYDNSGLLIGDHQTEVSGILVTLDCTEAVITEAVEKKCNLVIAHHPIIFGELKSLTGSNYVERTVEMAIREGVAVYAIHTNLDNISKGVNAKICQIVGIENISILRPKSNLLKLVTFIPMKDFDQVLDAIHSVGAGSFGKYSECSFSIKGTGTFRPDVSANPHIGVAGEKESVEEHRVEILFPDYLVSKVITALRNTHPYEEVAYYIEPLNNENTENGSGMIGELPEAMTADKFMNLVKTRMNLNVIKHTKVQGENIKRVAVCGGSGSFLIGDAMKAGAQAFITSDIKYHDFFDGEDKLLVMDIGHYESEVFTKDLLHDILCENFATFAVNLSETVTNPISYF